jgi:hypothetical protein
VKVCCTAPSAELERPVRDVVADPSMEVRAEAEGMERFAPHIKRDGWDRARALSLPYEENGYFLDSAGKYSAVTVLWSC